MDEQETNWRGNLHRDLIYFTQQFTTERYPANLETQRTIDQGLHLLEQSYGQRLDDHQAGERAQFNQLYKERELARLNEVEREAQQRARNPNDLWAIRAGQRGEREALEDGTYRESQDYKDAARNLMDQQLDDREALDRAVRLVDTALYERFGFSREQDRSQDRDERDR